jgi:transcription initiation factor IIF auxiliary subunit
MMFRSRFISCLILMAMVCFAGVARAELGAIPLSPEEFDKLPEWKPDDEGVGEFYRIDLRRYLPPVGNQGSQNSCTGFAVGYAAKTYLEVRDQNWQPNVTSRIFSPAFIYNQINKGRDRGSSIVRAIYLLKNKGCSTLSTMRYSDRDYRTQPTARAVKEAGKYKVRGFYTVKTGAKIRTALRQGHVVVICIKTDPIFRSGRYKVFGKAEKARGDKARGANEKHGFHAMVVVGYDDSRQAFLLMNSWGPAWGQKGYCWVSYDQMAKVENRGNKFLREAYVILDVTEDVTAPVRPPAAKAVSTWGRLYYVGYVKGKHRWTWRAGLLCSSATAAQVSRVVWSVPGPRGPITATRTKAADSFGVNGYRTGPGKMTLTATVHFKDRTWKKLSRWFRFAGPTVKQRRISLIQTDRYWGVKGRQDYWEWSVKLTGSLTDMADVQQVTYHLDRSFPIPNPIVRGTPRNGFEYTTRGWGAFKVRATVLFKDRTKLPLEIMLKFRSPVKRQLHLTNFAQRSRVAYGKQVRYDWTAYVDGPLALLRQIRSVEYLLHRTFKQNRIFVSHGLDYGFPLSRNGWGAFNLKAKVHFTNGATQTLQHKLQFAGAPKYAINRSGIR